MTRKFVPEPNLCGSFNFKPPTWEGERREIVIAVTRRRGGSPSTPPRAGVCGELRPWNAAGNREVWQLGHWG